MKKKSVVKKKRCFQSSILEKKCQIMGQSENPTSKSIEPRHDKTNKVTVRPAKTQISLGICPGWSESSLSAWRNLGSLATNWAHSEDSDQTGRMPRLIWVFAGRTLILLVLSCHSSIMLFSMNLDNEFFQQPAQNNLINKNKMF